MEIYGARVKEQPVKHALLVTYPADLNMYTEIPNDKIDIELFQELAVERVKLLKVFDTVYAKSVRNVPFKEQVIEEAMNQKLKFFMPLLKGTGDPDSRRYDHLSHYVLRLFYCRSEDYRKWFIARELDFFRLKFYNTNRKEDVVTFMKRNDLKYKPIQDAEKRANGRNIVTSIPRKKVILETTDVYKVPFTQVLDLVRKRRVFIKNGYCYVTHQDFGSVLNTVFRCKLSYALSICAANIPVLEGDERMSRILKGLHNSNIESGYVMKSKDRVPISALDALSVKSFPLCMREMHETFRKTHHLKHMARLQYGLFLKGIGVTMIDSLKFWKEGFTKKEGIDAEKFEKVYAYSIRHNYGKEGKRANYTPHSCMKIIMTGVGPNDNHGCPFKHSGINSLRQKLLSYGISVNDVTDIINYVSNNHYQLACTKYFEVTHGISNAKGVNHPNAYFDESQKIIAGKEKEASCEEKMN